MMLAKMERFFLLQYTTGISCAMYLGRLTSKFAFTPPPRLNTSMNEVAYGEMAVYKEGSLGLNFNMLLS